MVDSVDSLLQNHLSMESRWLLGIETSCDECSVAVLKHHLPSSDSSSFGKLEVQVLNTFSQGGMHQPYGGVVPEVASRNHLETIHPLVQKTIQESKISFEDLDAIAVTQTPGLVGALLVGVTCAKTLAYVFNKPLVAVNHLEAHLFSPFLDLPEDHPLHLSSSYPMLLVLVSGGHTQLHCISVPPLQWSDTFLKESCIGQSRDDAAGEAFDKTAKLLGLPYPGGQWIDHHAEKGNPNRFPLPRALPQKSTFDFSFSGLKSQFALLVEGLRKNQELEKNLSDLCASVQEAIVDTLLRKISLAIDHYSCRSVIVVGGVAANRRLRAKVSGAIRVPTYFPPLRYCTDNAAMIAGMGAIRFEQGKALTGEQMLTLNAHVNKDFPTRHDHEVNIRGQIARSSKKTSSIRSALPYQL